MGAITEGSVVTICVEVKTQSGSVRDATGTVFWLLQNKVGVMMPCGIILYGNLGQVFPAQLDGEK
jgi:hypothetical protein